MTNTNTKEESVISADSDMNKFQSSNKKIDKLFISDEEKFFNLNYEFEIVHAVVWSQKLIATIKIFESFVKKLVTF